MDVMSPIEVPGRTAEGPAEDGVESAARPKLQARNLSFYYGKFQALHDINLQMAESGITALIGPSGCGKSTFLRTLNRISETIPETRVEGIVTLDGEDVLQMDVTALRRRVGMVFQRPNPFPKPIFANVAYGVRVNGLGGRGSLGEIV